MVMNLNLLFVVMRFLPIGKCFLFDFPSSFFNYVGLFDLFWF